MQNIPQNHLTNSNLYPKNPANGPLPAGEKTFNRIRIITKTGKGYYQHTPDGIVYNDVVRGKRFIAG